MRSDGAFETTVGAVVVAAAALFLVYAYGAAGKTFSGDYELNAVFGRIDGVSEGAEVRIAGVKVGAVTQSAIDAVTYEARVTMAIDGEIAVPSDSVAKVAANGLLGGAHISIEPGASEDMLAAGDQIVLTQGSVDLLGLAVQAFTSPQSSGENGASGTGADDLTALPPIEGE